MNWLVQECLNPIDSIFDFLFFFWQCMRIWEQRTLLRPVSWFGLPHMLILLLIVQGRYIFVHVRFWSDRRLMIFREELTSLVLSLSWCVEIICPQIYRHIPVHGFSRRWWHDVRFKPCLIQSSTVAVLSHEFRADLDLNVGTILFRLLPLLSSSRDWTRWPGLNATFKRFNWTLLLTLGSCLSTGLMLWGRTTSLREFLLYSH